MSELEVQKISLPGKTSAVTGSDHSDAPLGQRMEDWLFGYDYFLAHRSTDGRDYALALYEELTKQGNELSCFLDVKNYPAGGKLIAMQARALKKTTRLLVIVTPDAHLEKSTYLLKEVQEFQRLHPQGVIVPIGRRASLMQRWFPGSGLLPLLPRFPDAICIIESAQAFRDHKPSEATVVKLLNDFTEERRATKRLRWIKAVALLLLLLAIAATGLGWRANEAAIREKEARKIAEEQTKVAEENERNTRATLCRSDYLRSLEFSSKEESAMAIAYLVRGLRSFPEDQIAAERLAVVLRQLEVPAPLPGTKKISAQVVAFAFDEAEESLMCLTDEGVMIDFNIETRPITNQSWQGPVGANKIWILPDGKTVIVAGTMETADPDDPSLSTRTSFVEAWDRSMKTSLWRVQREGDISVDLRPDSQRILVASSATIEEFDLLGKATRPAFEMKEGCDQVCYGADHSLICLLSGKTIRGYHLDSKIFTFEKEVTSLAQGLSFTVSHDRKQLAVFGGYDQGTTSDSMPQGYSGFCHLMDSSTGRILHNYGDLISDDDLGEDGEDGVTHLEGEHGFFPTKVHFSADDSALGITSDAGDSFWVDTKEFFKARQFTHKPVLMESYSELADSYLLSTAGVAQSKGDGMYISHCNGGRIASGGSYRLISHLSFFSDNEDIVRDSLVVPGGISSFVFSERRRLLVAETAGEIRFWVVPENESSTPTPTLQLGRLVASGSEDRQLISIKEGSLHFFSVADQRELQSPIPLDWIDGSLLGSGNNYYANGHLVHADASGVIHIWNLSRRQIVAQMQASDHPRLTISPKGDYFCCEFPKPESQDSEHGTRETRKIVKVATGEIVAAFTDRYWDFAGDDSYVVSRDESIIVFETATGRLRTSIPIEGHFACMVSEDLLLYYEGSELTSIHIWDLAANRIVKSWDLSHYGISNLKAKLVDDNTVAICAVIGKYPTSKLQIFDFRSGVPKSPILDGSFDSSFGNVGENFFRWGGRLYEKRDWTVVNPEFRVPQWREGNQLFTAIDEDARLEVSGDYFLGNRRSVPQWVLGRALQVAGYRWEQGRLKRSEPIKPDQMFHPKASEAWQNVFRAAHQ